MYGQKFTPIIVGNWQIHVALCHLCQFIVNVVDILFQFPFRLMDGFHQHTDFGGVGFPLEICGKVSLCYLSHLIPHRDDGPYNPPAYNQHTENQQNSYDGKGQHHQSTDGVEGTVKSLHFIKGTGVQSG